jgi:hypothetical protein
MIDNQLLVGIVLIAAGVAVGLLAYALVLNRRDAAAHQGAEVGAEAAEAGEEEQLEASVEVDQDEEIFEEEASEPLGEPEAPLRAPVTETAVLSEEKGGAPGKRYEVATLLRNEESGKLALIVGDREYASPWELKGTEDWASVERAAKDLGWKPNLRTRAVIQNHTTPCQEPRRRNNEILNEGWPRLASPNVACDSVETAAARPVHRHPELHVGRNPDAEIRGSSGRQCRMGGPAQRRPPTDGLSTDVSRSLTWHPGRSKNNQPRPPPPIAASALRGDVLKRQDVNAVDVPSQKWTAKGLCRRRVLQFLNAITRIAAPVTWGHETIPVTGNSGQQPYLPRLMTGLKF